MPICTTRDGVEIFYKDWGQGRPVVFIHGWPLNGDAWQDQLKAVVDAGYRGIAHDRRGHGHSTPVWDGYDFDTFADDLNDLLTHLDLRDVTLVAHSMGGGELARYIGRHGTGRLRSAVLLSAIPPVMIKSDKNPEGVPDEVFDALKDGVLTERSHRTTKERPHPGTWAGRHRRVPAQRPHPAPRHRGAESCAGHVTIASYPPAP
ncbi:alpha/beta fold hydrolase [Streptomyces sp. NPDC058067]|uniref:alpha/beta fold hydrolase n=1 Tax=Streptomyces sp. NPDC058067 TaxID=3346324 RepID=UPI0036EBD657